MGASPGAGDWVETIASPNSMSLFVVDPVLFRNMIKQRVGMLLG